MLERHRRPDVRTVEPVAFDGNGLTGEFRGESWTEIRDEIYAGSGA